MSKNPLQSARSPRCRPVSSRALRHAGRRGFPGMARKGALRTVLALGAAIGLTVGGPRPADGSQTVDTAAVDAVFAEYDRTDAPGCALGVIRNGEFTYRRGYGMANLEYGIAIASDSIFRIGSTSKQFTAASVAMLARSGAIGLDDPLRKYFPEFPGWADSVTIRQLIHHTSGIRDYLELAMLAGKGDDADYYTDDWVLDLLARQRETNFPPGTQYLYSNSGYLLLAHLIERVTGQNLRAYAQARIFGPLGMGRTHFHNDHTEIVPRRASGYAPRDRGYRISMTTLDMIGDGGVFTSIDELLAWDRNFYHNRLGGGQAFIDELTTPGALADGTPLDYAFALRVDEWRGIRRISHGGSFVGYRADFQRFPTEHLSVAVLCNRADANPTALAGRVAALYLADRLQPPSPRSAPGEPLDLDATELARYAGDFWEADEGFAAEVRVIDGELWAVHSPTRRDRLVPVGPDRFRMVGPPAGVYVQYTMDGDRIVQLERFIDGELRGHFTPFERRQVRTAELAAYAGDYYSPELDVVYRLGVRDGTLVFELDEEPAREITALFGETFETPDFGAFTFERSEDGTVTGFRLQSGRVRNLAFHRQ